MRLLSLFARPEEDLLLCAGTLARCAQQGAELIIAAGRMDPAAAIQAVRELGPAQLVDLACLDHMEGVDALLADLFRSQSPDAVIVQAPGPGAPPSAGEKLRAAACRAFQQLADAGPLRASKLYHRALPSRQLEQGYAALARAGIQPRLFSLEEAATPETAISTIIDVQEQVPAKVRALRALAIGPIPELSSKEMAPLFGREFFVRMHPSPWITGVIERDLSEGLSDRWASALAA